MELQPLSSRSKLVVGGVLVAGASLALAFLLASRKSSAGSDSSTTGASLLDGIRSAFGYGPTVDERHAAAVFEVVAENIETIVKRITTLHTRALAAGVPVQSTLVDTSSGTNANNEKNRALVGDRANGYYYFSSDGKRLKTKWDSFDVDSACAELDNEPSTSAPSSAKKDKAVETRTAESSAAASAGVVKPASIDPITLRALRTEAGGVEKACETCMEDLDTVNGTAVTVAQKKERKDLVARLHSILQHVDEVLKPVNELL